ncbi:MAG: serine hydrolase domain-containing protein, partial [Phycisphaerae bacterium]
LQWERPLLVKETLGEFPLTTRWFDRDLNEVTAPAKPGRYAYYVEGTTADGMKVRRGGTMFCKPSLWEPWRERPRADLAPLAAAFINREAAAQRRDAISEFAGRMIMESIKMQGDGAVLMSYLYEMTPTEGSLSRADTPRIRDCDFHVGVKRRLLGIESKWPVLQPPQKIANPAPVLRDGTPDEAGVKPGTAAALRDICNEWYDASGEPFVLLVARHGVIVIHEAFGKDADGPLSLDAALPVASITKLLTGLLFAQFFHQGLIEIDDPVGEYLPDFPTAGDKAITLRHCFTHTSGLEGHQEWGGLHRPWMENRISNSLAHLQPGKVHLYNGMGYDLAGRVMEMVAGKSVFRLMREQMFDPLGMTESFNDEDLGFGAHVTAKDLAIFAQLLLNKGAYGDLRFFSPDVFGAMMPRPLDEFYPGLDVEWGIGLTWMRQAHPDAGRQNVPTDRTVLGQNIIGHGAATAAILRADLDHDLVIAQSRRTAGPRYNEFLTKLMMTIEENLAE